MTFLNVPVGNQNRNLGNHLRLFLLDHPNNWSTQTQMYAYAHSIIPIANFKLSP